MPDVTWTRDYVPKPLENKCLTIVDRGVNAYDFLFIMRDYKSVCIRRLMAGVRMGRWFLIHRFRTHGEVSVSPTPGYGSLSGRGLWMAIENRRSGLASNPLSQPACGRSAEIHGEEGGPDLAIQLGLPPRTWQNYESGVTLPAEVLLRFLEITGAEPHWLLHGAGPRYRVRTDDASAEA